MPEEIHKLPGSLCQHLQTLWLSRPLFTERVTEASPNLSFLSSLLPFDWLFRNWQASKSLSRGKQLNALENVSSGFLLWTWVCWRGTIASRGAICSSHSKFLPYFAEASRRNPTSNTPRILTWGWTFQLVPEELMQWMWGGCPRIGGNFNGLFSALGKGRS